jgi:hypothetical protein
MQAALTLSPGPDILPDNVFQKLTLSHTGCVNHVHMHAPIACGKHELATAWIVRNQ